MTPEQEQVVQDSKVMIAVPTGEAGRHPIFWTYLNMLFKPENALVSMVHGQSPAQSRNMMIDAALEQDCTHILFIDDDMAFDPNAMVELIKHDLDIVGGFYLMRKYPHQPLLFDQFNPEDNSVRWMDISDDAHGVIEVVSTGLGFCLFKLHVFEELERPYVRLGEYQKDSWCDDIGLFNRLREKGFKIHVDLDITVAHIGNMTIRPVKQDGMWMADLGTFGNETLRFPIIRLNQRLKEQNERELEAQRKRQLENKNE